MLYYIIIPLSCVVLTYTGVYIMLVNSFKVLECKMSTVDVSDITFLEAPNIEDTYGVYIPFVGSYVLIGNEINFDVINKASILCSINESRQFQYKRIILYFLTSIFCYYINPFIMLMIFVIISNLMGKYDQICNYEYAFDKMSKNELIMLHRIVHSFNQSQKSLLTEVYNFLFTHTIPNNILIHLIIEKLKKM